MTTTTAVVAAARETDDATVRSLLCAYVRWSTGDAITGAGRLNDEYADRLETMIESDASVGEAQHIARLIDIDYDSASVDDLVAWTTLPTHALDERAETLFGGRLLRASNSLMREAFIVGSMSEFLSIKGLLVVHGSDPTADRIPHLVRGLDVDTASAILGVPKETVSAWLSGAKTDRLLVDAAASAASWRRLVDWIDEGLVSNGRTTAQPSFGDVIDAKFYLTPSGGSNNAILWASMAVKA